MPKDDITDMAKEVLEKSKNLNWEEVLEDTPDGYQSIKNVNTAIAYSQFQVEGIVELSPSGLVFLQEALSYLNQVEGGDGLDG